MRMPTLVITTMLAAPFANADVLNMRLLALDILTANGELVPAAAGDPDVETTTSGWALPDISIRASDDLYARASGYSIDGVFGVDGTLGIRTEGDSQIQSYLIDSEEWIEFRFVQAVTDVKFNVNLAYQGPHNTVPDNAITLEGFDENSESLGTAIVFNSGFFGPSLGGEYSFEDAFGSDILLSRVRITGPSSAWAGNTDSFSGIHISTIEYQPVPPAASTSVLMLSTMTLWRRRRTSSHN